jgi:hypothetical protein
MALTILPSSISQARSFQKSLAACVNATRTYQSLNNDTGATCAPETSLVDNPWISIGSRARAPHECPALKEIAGRISSRSLILETGRSGSQVR